MSGESALVHATVFFVGSREFSISKIIYTNSSTPTDFGATSGNAQVSPVMIVGDHVVPGINLGSPA